jgi:hypothetical protein
MPICMVGRMRNLSWPGSPGIRAAGDASSDSEKEWQFANGKWLGGCSYDFKSTEGSLGVNKGYLSV